MEEAAAQVQARTKGSHATEYLATRNESITIVPRGEQGVCVMIQILRETHRKRTVAVTSTLAGAARHAAAARTVNGRKATQVAGGDFQAQR